MKVLLIVFLITATLLAMATLVYVIVDLCAQRRARKNVDYAAQTRLIKNQSERKEESR